MPRGGMGAARAVLEEVFGYAAFRPGQRESVAAAVARKDTVVLLPTGRGKSLCYQVPGIVASRAGLGTTVVVSPLIALINDQVDALRGRGVAAAALHSHLDAAAQRETVRALMQGELEFIFVSPERAGQARFRKSLGEITVGLIAIDEAHCVSQWGHDFRPDYLRLHELRALVEAPIVALTATATPRVMDEIAKHLELRDPTIVRGDFERPNLTFAVCHASKQADRIKALRSELERAGFSGRKGPGRVIVYCSTRKAAQTVNQELRSAGFAAGYYHAGRTQLARERAHRSFAAGRTTILAATNAYGMGIDFPDVRLIFHYQAPGSLEAYYQEAGRAGRDGEPARCVLCFAESDLTTQRRLATRGSTSPMRLEDTLGAVRSYACEQACRQATLCAHFTGRDDHAACGHCDACSSEALPDVDIAVPAPICALAEDDLERIVQAVDRLRRPVGKRNLARALRGSKAKTLSRGGLLTLPEYGTLHAYDERSIVAAIESLLQEGRLKRTGRRYPTVWIPGKPVRGAEAKDPGETPSRATRTPRRQRPNYNPLTRALEDFRRRKARELRWKPYMVFQRHVIKSLEQHSPESLEELARVPGLGPAKVERFGEALLAIVRQHSRSDEWWVD